MCWLSGVTMETVIQWTAKNPSKPARQPAGYAFEHTSQGQVFASILACYYWPAATGNRTKTNPSDCASTQHKTQQPHPTAPPPPHPPPPPREARAGGWGPPPFSHNCFFFFFPGGK